MKRHLEAADMQIHMRARRQRRGALTGQTLNFLQQIQQSHYDKPDAIPEFCPSSRLQNLFQQCLELDTSDTSESFDYDQLILPDFTHDNLLQNIEKIWSMYDIGNDGFEEDQYNDDEISINYDDVIHSNHVLDETLYGLTIQEAHSDL